MHSNDDVYPSGNKVIMGDFNGQHYPPPPLLPLIPIIMDIGVRANIHWGGGNRFLPEWIPTVGGGGVVAEIFQDP